MEDIWGTERPRASYMAWFFVVAMGVFVGNVGLFAVQKAVDYWELQQFTQALSVSTQNMKAEAEARRKSTEAKIATQRKQQAELARQRQIVNERNQNAIRITRENCNFWIQQVSKENTSLNRMYRDSACQRLRDLQ